MTVYKKKESITHAWTYKKEVKNYQMNFFPYQFYETYVPFEFLERFIKFVFYIKLVFSVKDIP